MSNQKITKRSIEAITPTGKEFTLWDSALPGFGVRVRSSGAKAYIVVYRAGAGRGAPVRRFTSVCLFDYSVRQRRERRRNVQIHGFRGF